MLRLMSQRVRPSGRRQTVQVGLQSAIRLRPPSPKADLAGELIVLKRRRGRRQGDAGTWAGQDLELAGDDDDLRRQGQGLAVQTARRPAHSNRVLGAGRRYVITSVKQDGSVSMSTLAHEFIWALPHVRAAVAVTRPRCQVAHVGSGSACKHCAMTSTFPRAFEGRSTSSMVAKCGSTLPAVRGARRSRCWVCRSLVRSPKNEAFVRQVRHNPRKVLCSRR